MFRRFFISLLEIAEVALITLGAVYLVHNFLIQPFLVRGSSMEPNYSNNNYLLVDQLTYRLREPERGEVVIFHFPEDHRTYFIKRIIGLPGEEVHVHEGEVVVVNEAYPDGLVLNELYLPPGARTNGSVDVTLGPNEYFVLGDNRSYSFDSRSWGVLTSNEVVGLARLRLWPLNEVQAFAAPQY